MTVNFDLVRSSNSNQNLHYSATDAIIMQISLSSNGDRTTETITISFKKIVIGLPDGPDLLDHLAPDVMGYDLAHIPE
jgi:type VI protein secretion system component Hcp